MVYDKDGKEINLGYVLEGEPKSIEDIKKVFKAFQLDKYFEAIQPLIRPKIDLTLIPSDENEIKLGQSKIGGKPDLVNQSQWAKTEENKSMSFIAQLNCEELLPYDKQQLFPKRGLISFFYCADQEAWGFDPKDRNRFKVIFTEEVDNLNRVEFPIDLEEHSIFNPNKLSFDSSLSIPTWQEDSIEGLIEDRDSDNYIEASNGPENQILGYAKCVQGTMELECQLVSNGIYCGDPSGYSAPRRATLEAGKNDWLLLLQIDSEEDKAGMMWGDVGKIYYWIKKDDLINKRFDRSWCILQCH